MIERHAQLLLLGSASPVLMKQAGESLAGRMSLLFVSGLGLHEARALDPDWLAV